MKNVPLRPLHGFGLEVLLAISLLIIIPKSPVESQSGGSVCDGVCDLSWSPTDDTLLAAVNQYGLWLYEIGESGSGPILFAFPSATSLDFSPDGESIAITACPALDARINTCQGIVSIFNIKHRTWNQVRQFDYKVDNIQFNPNGNSIAFVQSKTNARGLHMIDLSSTASATIVDPLLTNLIAAYDFSPNGEYIVISNGSPVMNADDFNGATVWDANTGLLMSRTEGNIFRKDVAFLPDSSSIALVENDSRVSIWNFTENIVTLNHVMIATLADPLNDYNLVDKPLYLLGSLLDDWHPRDRTLHIWNVRTLNEIFSVDVPPNHWHDLLEINSSARFLAASSSRDESQIVDIWQVKTNEHFQVVLSE